MSESRCFNLGIEYGRIETLLKRRFSLIFTIALFSVFILLFFGATCEGADLTLNHSSGIWIDAEIPSTGHVTGLNTNEIRWGTALPGGERSGYRFDGSDDETFGPGEDFLLGDFWHFNWPIWPPAITWAELKVTLHFIDPPILPDPTFTFRFDHEETPNDPPCAYQSDTPCADRVTFPDDIADETFEIDGVFYTLQIVGFVNAYPSGDPVDEFITQENQNNSAYLVGRILVCAPDISIEKLTNGEDADDAPGPHIPVGDPVEWTYEVQNTGNVSLTGIIVVDDNGTPDDSIDDVTICSGITLDPGHSHTFTASDTAVAGQYGNIATATGNYSVHTYNDTDPSHYFGSDCANYHIEYLGAYFDGTNTNFSYNVSADSPPAVSHWVLALDSCIEEADIVSATENWKFGTDPTTGLRGIKFDDLEIEAGESQEFFFVLAGYWPEGDTEAAIKAGTLICYNNTTGPVCTADILIVKTADYGPCPDKPVPGPGTKITYTINVTNKGNVNLTDVNVTDIRLGLIQEHFSDKLEPGYYVNKSYTYTVKEGDICDNITNTAIANSTDPFGYNVNDSDSWCVPITYNASLNVTKTANFGPCSDPSAPKAKPGDSIVYTINVSNDGNVTLRWVNITDSKLGLTNYDMGTLTPGTYNETTFTYDVTESDMCNDIDNTVDAQATDRCGNGVTDSASWCVPTDYIATLNVTKTADYNFGGSPKPGDIITYTINVTNLGNVNLTDVNVVDSLIGTLTDPSGDDNGDGCLNLTETWTYTGTYTVKDVDLCGGWINNTVTANATDPCTNPLEAEANHSIPIMYICAGFGVNKEADYGPSPDGKVAKPGDIINYTITVYPDYVFNLTDVNVVDSLIDLTGPEGDVNDDQYLNTTEIWNYTGNYTVTDNDVCSTIENTVTANATDPCGNVLDDTSANWYVPTTSTPVLNVTKTADYGPCPDGKAARFGDNVTYTITVLNDGDVNLTDVVVTDPKLDLDRLLFSGNLEPGTNVEKTFEYTVKLADLNLDTMNNTVVANSTDPCGNDVNDTGSWCIPIEYEPDVNKTALQKSVERGDEITYIIEVHNMLGRHNVIVRDAFYRHVEFVSASPMPDSGGVWRFDTVDIDPLVITLVVKVPETQDFEFGMGSGISGEGFVNVADDYSTTLQPYDIKNCVYVTSDETGSEVFSDCEHVTVGGDLGTELSTREHGSGDYESDEQIKMLTENKSIEMKKDVTAEYKPTTLGLYRNRSITYDTKWTEKARAKNRITGATMYEAYHYATSLDRNSYIKLDKNGSTMVVDSEFEGMGHIGILKKGDNRSTVGDTPLFESREDYTGSFRIYERVDEYGSSVVSDKSTTGTGLVAVEKRVKDTQKTYESGTGS